MQSIKCFPNKELRKTLLNPAEKRNPRNCPLPYGPCEKVPALSQKSNVPPAPLGRMARRPSPATSKSNSGKSLRPAVPPGHTSGFGRLPCRLAVNFQPDWVVSSLVHVP